MLKENGFANGQAIYVVEEGQEEIFTKVEAQPMANASALGGLLGMFLGQNQ